MQKFTIGERLQRQVDVGKGEMFWTFWVYRGEDEEGGMVFDLYAKSLSLWEYTNSMCTMKRRKVAPLWNSVSLTGVKTVAMTRLSAYTETPKFDTAPVR